MARKEPTLPMRLDRILGLFKLGLFETAYIQDPKTYTLWIKG